MKLLGFETTDVIASVALYLDGVCDEMLLSAEKRHAESVLPAAEELLRRHGLKTSDMDAFAVDIGPGSFTGEKLIAVNSLETLAQPFQNENAPVCALIDARNGNGYGAVYRGGECLVPPAACELEPFMAALSEDCRITGTAAEDRAMPRASSVVLIASGRQGEKQVSPLYLKLSQAERMRL